jgi:hypothetical protein
VTVATHLPRSQEGQRFCQFFNHRFNFIKAPNAGKEAPEWQTISAYPIEHRNLWNAFLDPKTLVGLSFAPTTHYALLDIDSNSPYHPANNEKAFRELLGAYEDVGFNESITLQSSGSGGLHVYLVLPKEEPTHKLAVMLKLTAIRSGFIVKDGTLEIFPNAKPYNKEHPTPYKAHRLPLQEGSFLLDQNFDPYSNNIKTFLDLADSVACAQDIDVIEAAIEAADKAKAFRHIKGDGKKAAAFAQDLKEQIQEGWTDFGQTNDLLRVIGTYGRVFEGLGGQELADYIANTAKSLPGYQEYCRHQHQLNRRALEWARCVEKFYYPYGSQPTRGGTFQEIIDQGTKENQGNRERRDQGTRENQVNKERQQSAVDRIKEGVDYLRRTLSELPRKVGEMKDALLETLSSLFGVRPSDKTLNKHKELWHPQFILEEEIVVIPDSWQEIQEEEAEPETTGESVPEENGESVPTPLAEEGNNETLSNRPEAAAEGKFEPCPTPLAEEGKNETVPNRPEAAAEGGFPESATPPFYMKVRAWAESQTPLTYQGHFACGLVLVEGENRRTVQLISQNQLVLIDSCHHSSFLFSPDDEQNLLVYVKPIEQQTNWQDGVAVRAKDLSDSS